MIRTLINFIISFFVSSVKDEMKRPAKKVAIPVTTYGGECLNLVKHFEGSYLKAYKDVVGVWTIGYGHTNNVKDRDMITNREAINLLKDDLNEAQRHVFSVVKVPLTQYQLDALVSFTFNLGIGNLTKSTLLRKLNRKNYKGAAAEFPRWKYAGGRVFKGLVRRRNSEMRLFLGLDNLEY